MAIPVKLPVFEGPLDLLLHLIDKNKIDIYDIPIVEITDQYLEYIHQMEREDLDIMSEFMVMAATLLDIKCRMLLPKEVNEEGEEEDSRGEPFRVQGADASKRSAGVQDAGRHLRASLADFSREAPYDL